MYCICNTLVCQCTQFESVSANKDQNPTSKLSTPCPKKNGPFRFSSISLSNHAQISKSGTVLKSARSQLSKTVPDFEI